MRYRIKQNSKQTGFSLVELMISLTVASILSVVVVSAFSSQSHLYMKQARRMQTNDDGRQAFDILSRLIRHAKTDSVVVTDNNTDITIAFSIPRGFPIWPNVSGGFTDNFIFIKWADHNDATNGFIKNQILISKAATNAMPANNTFEALAGSDTGNNTRVTDLNLTKQADNINYRLNLAVRTAAAINPVVTAFDGIILPRN